jgi:mannonate dehydratase
MKITAARVIVCCPGRNFVTLIIETDEGLTGIGDATLNGRELSVVSYLEEHVIPCLIGRDPQQIEDIWQYLYKGAYWRRGPVTMTSIAAVDTALWDIKGKIAGQPLYQLLGGRSRTAIMSYAHATGRDTAETVDEVLRHKEMGYMAIRAQSGIPGLNKVYGVSGNGRMYEPADGPLPGEHDWNTEKYLRHTPGLFQAVREAVGPDTHLLHDAHHRLTPIEAGRLGKELEPFHLFWLEDLTPAENQEAFKLIRHHTTTPLAVGEIFNTVWDCKDLIEQQLIDYIRTTVTHAGGITHLRVIANLASLYQVRTGCHGPTDLSPVCMGAALHFDTWVPNFGIQEHMAYSEEMLSVFPHDWRFEKGMLYCGESPGHGVGFDEKLAAKYPYKRAYLPVNRLQHDGTLWSW